MTLGNLPPKKERTRKEKIILGVGIFLASVLTVVLLVFGAYHMILDYYLGKIQIVTTGEDELQYVTQPIFDPYIPTGTEEVKTLDPEKPILPETNPEAPEQTKEPTSPPPVSLNLPLICNTEHVTNILLIGCDSSGNYAGRSDVMMLCSINTQTKKIVLCSLMRDILANFPGGSYDKLCHAHAYGGPNRVMEVLKLTFNIQVSHYVRVNFTAFETVINAVNGIDVDLDLQEIQFINSSCDPDLPLREGVHHLNGSQALIHVRNRSSVGADHDRTRRQREVISLLIRRVAGMSLLELDEMLDLCLPLVTTNMSKSMLKSFVNNALTYAKYQVVSIALPRQGTYISGIYQGMWLMQVDREANSRYLYEQVYGTPAP